MVSLSYLRKPPQRVTFPDSSGKKKNKEQFEILLSVMGMQLSDQMITFR